MSTNCEKILIIKPSSLGDIVLALPALSALRRNFPDAKISWLVRPEFAPLLENHPHLNEVIPFDRKLFGKAWYRPKAFAALMSLIKRLRRSKFDVVFDFQGLFRTASLAWLTGCKNRFGMSNARELAHLFYTYRVEQDQNCIHLVDYYLKMIKATGTTDINVQFELPVNPYARDSVKKILASHNIKYGEYVVFVPGSAHSDKCWPVENFADLADKISLDFGLPIIAIGTESEKAIVEAIKNLTDVPIINFAGQTSLSELITLLEGARLVVSNDTGPGHIAAALGTPLVMIIGRSNPARIGPYGRSECIVAREPYSRGFKINNDNIKHSVTAITVDEVYQKAYEQLNT
jgi:lipopolysaccharide heptosyltransferase I